MFEDWCTALEYSALPATPDILARFFDAHPAAVATQRRRITVIDAVHHRTGLPAPGRSETVRGAIDIERAERLRELAARLGRIIARLPVSGWPAALFARRDALILVLASTGMPYSQIATLRVCDVTADRDTGLLRIRHLGSVETVTPEALTAMGGDATQVLRRWLEVLGHQQRYPSTRLLAEQMAAGNGTELTGFDRHLRTDTKQQLLTSIDRWGHTPISSVPCTARTVADIVRAHLHNRAPVHTPIVPPLDDDEDARRPTDAMAGQDIVLDTAYYELGIAARKQAFEQMADVDCILDEVENRAQELLARLMAVIDNDQQ